MERPAEVAGLYRTLDKLLADPGQEERSVLHEHLGDPNEPDADDTAQARAAILDYLRQSGNPKLLRECGLLKSQLIIQSFPQNFGAYLSSLDFLESADQDELAHRVNGLR